MSDITTHLLLPYILASQAQKHVTHNEALRLLDAMVALSVLDRDLTAPPASPADGDRHIVASSATGLWTGWDLNVTFWVDGVWLRLVPRPGWLAWVADEAAFVVWNGSAWDPVGEPVDVSDAIFSLVNDADPTKKALFSLSGISTGTTRTFTLPNTSSELAILAGTQTFTGNKTFSGTLTASGTVTVSAAAASIGTATTSATYGMGTGVTTSGVTKTLNLGTGGASGSTTVVNIGSVAAGAGGTTVLNTPTVTFANAVTQVGMPQANLTAQTLGLGGAAADSYNRFSVNAPAMLFNNAGNGIEATFNKNAPGEDAAFAFKTGFSARALLGLLGTDNFSVKVSPDGNTFHAAITIDRTSGRVELPEPLVMPALATAPEPPPAGKLAVYARARRGRMARCAAPLRAGLFVAAAFRGQPDRHLGLLLWRDHHHQWHAAHRHRQRDHTAAATHQPLHQHAPLAVHQCRGGRCGCRGTIHRVGLLARHCRRTWRLEVYQPRVAEHGSANGHGLLRALRRDHRAGRHADARLCGQLHRHRLSARHPRQLAAGAQR